METTDNSGLVTVVTDQVDKKIQNTLDIGAKALQSAEVQSMIRAYGLESYIKNVRQDQVKNIFAVAGAYYLFSKFKKQWPIMIAGFAGLYLYAKSTTPKTNPSPSIAQSNETVSNEEMSGYNF